MKLIIDAFHFAEEKHKGQVRKATGDAYLAHPVAVSYIVAKYKVSKNLEELIAAAYLHDCLEDTDTTFNELANKFGPLVASLVFELTNDKDAIAKVGKLDYLKKKMVAMSSYALILKLADRLHNVSDHPTQQMLVDTLELMNHLQGWRILNNTQGLLVREILQTCSNQLEG